MKFLLLAFLFALALSRPQCCENCGTAATTLEEEEIANSLEVFGLDVPQFKHPCMFLSICSVSCDKAFGFNCPSAVYFRITSAFHKVKYNSICIAQEKIKVKGLMSGEILQLMTKIRDPSISRQLNDIFSSFSEKVQRICEENRFPKSEELEKYWKSYLKEFPQFRTLGFQRMDSLGMSIYDYGLNIWKKATQYWARRCECTKIMNPTEEQIATARSECIKKCGN